MAKKKNMDAARLSALRMKKMTPAERQEVGRKGGRARSAKLTAAERREIGRKAAEARWSKEKAKGAGESE